MMLTNLINNMIEFPGRDPSIEVLLIDENKHFVTVSVTQKEISEINKNFGIDVLTKVSSVVNNEIYQIINKLISKEAFKKETAITFDSIEPLKEMLEMMSGFAIVNTKIAVSLQDDPRMECVPIFTRFSDTTGCMYKIGKFADVDIYVDPYITWDDTKCSIVTNNFYNYITDSSTQIHVSGAGSPKIQNDVYFKSNGPKCIIINIKKDKPLV